MKYLLRVIDAAGNGQDYEADKIPSIGELVMLEYGDSKASVRPHYFRVKDVLHNLQGAPGRQIGILIGEETEMNWPG
jgi:hypothetical protein